MRPVAWLMAGVRVGELLGFVRSLYAHPLPMADLVEIAGLEDILGRRADRLSGGRRVADGSGAEIKAGLGERRVRLTAIEWVALVGAVWLGSLPLTLIGFAIGYLVSAETASGIVTVLYFALGALGGLWMPVAMLPEAMQRLAHALPTNRIADLGWKIAAGQAPAAWSRLVLAGWTALAARLAVRSYQRAALR